MTLAERQEEQRAEESRENHSPNLDRDGEQSGKARQSGNCGSYQSDTNGSVSWMLVEKGWVRRAVPVSENGYKKGFNEKRWKN